jgi:restriction system protein
MTTHEKIIPAHGGYKKLKSYINAEIVYDATVRFCERFVDRRSRTVDQMVQAARSGKQNIAEASMASATSKETELKLVNVARASLEELMLDYRDYLRLNGHALWEKESREAGEVRAIAWEENRSYKSYRTYIEESLPEVAANTVICLIHQTAYLLDRQLRFLEEQFLKEGGFREKLYKARLTARKSPI